MKLAINWFQLSLSSGSLEIPAERITEGDDLPRARHHHRTLTRVADDVRIIYHFLEAPPPNTTLQAITVSDDPHLVNVLIEHAFSESLRSKHFRVVTGHVGAEGFYRTNRSTVPELYEFMKGLGYRAYMIKRRSTHEWGLILNFTTSQRFTISLEDPRMRQRAIGERVVAVGEGIRLGENDRPINSGILLKADSRGGVLSVGRDRRQVTIDLKQWTLPCRRDTLTNFVREQYGDQRSHEVLRQLQRDSFVIAANGRMNSMMAKDQLDEVRRIIRKHDLYSFTLPLPSRPPVMLSDTPMILDR
jgi:hypothetical protein